MKYRCVFIGIDRYIDPLIRDLSGAGNDARALWALFADTFPDADCTLFTDELATTVVITQKIESTLLDACNEDVSVVFFAGHGTRDHRLVAHDTARSDLINTTIAMQSVAELFRRTRAGVAILILDCCFSGGVTARVIEDSPASRDFSDPLSEVAGRGRILVTASRFDQPAYELPGHDHGLLTKALLDTLEAQERSSVLTIMENVMSRVRAEATRIGIEQTPVFLGEIEGGLVLPRLIRAQNHSRLFPELAGITVGNAIQDLKAFHFPPPILDEWVSRFPRGLSDVQLAAVNRFHVLNGKSLLVIAPTSAGKTFIGEMCAAKAITEGRKGIFLLPYRALVNEKYDQFQKSYGEVLGMRVIRCTGDYSDQIEQFVKGKYDLALLTYEMFLNLALAIPNTLQQLGLVVIDEAQFITDPSRGITVELLLTLLIAARERGINPQLLALSAVIGDANRFNEWLGVAILRTDQRPVP